ncbi:MAG: DUF58 domain-containing protein [Clostridia bacterium]|nr:DUF58 domain-containing protein [Clostridia bacterium]
MLIFWILLGFGFLVILQRAIYNVRWNKKISVTFRFSKRAVTEGESAELFERSENRKLLPLPVFGYSYTLSRSFASVSKSKEKTITMQRRFALPGRHAVTNRATIGGLSRGIYCVDVVTANATDLFHLIHLECAIPFSATRLTVYPAKIPVQRFSFPARLILGSVTTRRRAQEDPFALRSIRPYEIYDSPKIINWKASAKTGELKVNQFEYTTDESLLFLLDMGSGSFDDREELIRLASSLSLFFLRRGVSVSMMANCRDCIIGRPIRVPPGADAGHQITVDETLALIKLTIPVTESFRDFLAGVPHEALKHSLAVVLSADPTGDARAAFLDTPGIRDGYYVSVQKDGDVKAESRLQLEILDTSAKEVRL